MKFLILLFSATFLSGCFGLPNADNYQIKILGVNPIENQNQISTLISTCDDKCRVLIEKKFLEDSHEVGFNGLLVPYIQRIDGILGTTNYNRCLDCSGAGDQTVHNVFDARGFKIGVDPGEHVLDLYVQYWLARSNKIVSIRFESEADTTYFVGEVLDVIDRDRIHPKYRWHPVVVDTSNNNIIYPTDFNWVEG